MKKVYNKLVRDNIPEIIQAQGNVAKTSVLSADEYIRYLKLKLLEETNEFIEDECMEEICDIVEVVRAILEVKGFTYEDVDKLRIEKAERNGAFKKRLLLEHIDFSDERI